MNRTEIGTAPEGKSDAVRTKKTLKQTKFTEGKMWRTENELAGGDNGRYIPQTNERNAKKEWMEEADGTAASAAAMIRWQGIKTKKLRNAQIWLISEWMMDNEVGEWGRGERNGNDM